MEMKIELIPIPVTDADKAKDFYTKKLGFVADFNQKVTDNLRFIQLTPPGSACSIVMGVGITDMKPGSVSAYQMVVADAQAAHDELAKRGVEVSAIDVQSWGTFVYFSDPDGNKWSLQQLPPKK
ncbi:MAG TPA: glyoxalase superfamily protein [Candidatus Saccharimonadales bacterium]|nr:glyoxalase superfamily protein [Candidatus Saccharimonadales bacterium]